MIPVWSCTGRVGVGMRVGMRVRARAMIRGRLGLWVAMGHVNCEP